MEDSLVNLRNEILGRMHSDESGWASPSYLQRLADDSGSSANVHGNVKPAALMFDSQASDSQSDPLTITTPGPVAERIPDNGRPAAAPACPPCENGGPIQLCGQNAALVPAKASPPQPEPVVPKTAAPVPAFKALGSVQPVGEEKKAAAPAKAPQAPQAGGQLGSAVETEAEEIFAESEEEPLPIEEPKKRSGCLKRPASNACLKRPAAVPDSSVQKKTKPGVANECSEAQSSKMRFPNANKVIKDESGEWEACCSQTL